MHADPRALSTAVQRNCNIADAQHAADYTLCVYLLKMREYYRWEKGYALDAPLPQEEVGSWLKDREALWNTLAEDSYEPLLVDGETRDPFDTAAINAAIVPHGLVYSAGIGAKGMTHFFLGRLEHMRTSADVTVLVSGNEYARDLTAPPAMTLGRTVFVRRESLRRLIWEKVQEWLWQRHDNAMARALACYAFDQDADAALEAMTANELDTALHHEIGEISAARRLGPAWNEMLADLPRSRAELMARAVKDHLADALSTLPTLLEGPNSAALHFYMANLAGMRRQLYPSFVEAYSAWTQTRDLGPLRRLVERSAEHWQTTAEKTLALYHDQGAHCLAHVEALIEHSRL